jgi:hypothetical protein
MRYSLAISVFLITFCSCNPKIDLNNYLQGGVWCGYSELSEGEICIEFLEKDAYLKVKRERFINSIPYVVHKIDEGKKSITWEFVGEGTLNEFFVVSQDTVNFKQKGAKSFAKFIRKKHNY